jgi:tetratricopeptide (TPR) repeat protein
MERLASSAPQNLGAWECMLKGWWHIQKLSKDDNAVARSLFERAVEMDPNLAFAFAGLSRTHFYDVLHQWTASPSRSTFEAVRAAEECVSIDDRHHSGYFALGVAHTLTGQRGKEVAAFAEALRLNPSSSGAYFYLGVALVREGKPDEGIANIRKALTLSPRDPYTWSYLFGMAMAHFAAEQYEEAVDWAQRSLEHKADWPLTFTFLAASYAYLDRLDEAHSAVEGLRRLNPDFSLGGLNLLLTAAEPDFAERVLDGLRKAGLPE